MTHRNTRPLQPTRQMLRWTIGLLAAWHAWLFGKMIYVYLLAFYAVAEDAQTSPQPLTIVFSVSETEMLIFSGLLILQIVSVIGVSFAIGDFGITGLYVLTQFIPYVNFAVLLYLDRRARLYQNHISNEIQTVSPK